MAKSTSKFDWSKGSVGIYCGGISQPICRLRHPAGVRENLSLRRALKRPEETVPAAGSKLRPGFPCNKKKGKGYDAAGW